MSGVNGLVLAGGSSRRMHYDKAAIDYHGQPHLEWTYALVQAVCERAFVSVRAGQLNEPVRTRFPQIVDGDAGAGPVAGILAAARAFPQCSWLVVACDLPRLSRATLEHLLAMRDPSRDATAYVSSTDGLPEPLCAIWEPAGLRRAEDLVAQRLVCPRKILKLADTRLIEPIEPRALDNVNTPAELERARAALETMS